MRNTSTIGIRHPSVRNALNGTEGTLLDSRYDRLLKKYNGEFILTTDGFISGIQFKTEADLTYFLLRWE
jgi:hypothetical protein